MADRITKTIAVDRSADELYRIWSNFDNFPHFMRNIKSITRTGANTSHWVMEGPLGKDVEWDARVTDLVPGKRIRWESIRGDVDTAGEVVFNEIATNRTDVTVSMRYEAKGTANKLGALFSDPEGDLEEDLNNFRTYAEGLPQRQM